MKFNIFSGLLCWKNEIGFNFDLVRAEFKGTEYSRSGPHQKRYKFFSAQDWYRLIMNSVLLLNRNLVHVPCERRMFLLFLCAQESRTPGLISFSKKAARSFLMTSKPLRYLITGALDFLCYFANRKQLEFYVFFKFLIAGSFLRACLCERRKKEKSLWPENEGKYLRFCGNPCLFYYFKDWVFVSSETFETTSESVRIQRQRERVEAKESLERNFRLLDEPSGERLCVVIALVVCSHDCTCSRRR